MSVFTKALRTHIDLPEDQQKKAGKALKGAMTKRHEEFVEKVLKLVDSNEIDVRNPKSLLNMNVYSKLKQEWKDKTDIALMNIAHQLEDIVEFRLSSKTPDSSLQLQTMIEYLWQMKERIEAQGYDVFKF